MSHGANAWAVSVPPRTGATILLSYLEKCGANHLQTLNCQSGQRTVFEVSCLFLIVNRMMSHIFLSHSPPILQWSAVSVERKKVRSAFMRAVTELLDIDSQPRDTAMVPTC